MEIMSINYLKKTEGADYIATLAKPVYGYNALREKLENPDVFVDGKWHNSVPALEKVINGKDLVDTTGWTPAQGAILGVSNSNLSVSTADISGGFPYAAQILTGLTVGSLLTVRGNVTSSSSGNVSGSGSVFIIQTDDTSISSNWATVGGVAIFTTIVPSETLELRLVCGFTAASQVTTLDNISAFESKVIPDTPYDPPITYLPVEVEVDASGNPVQTTVTKKVQLVAEAIAIEEVIADSYAWNNDGIDYIDPLARGANRTAKIYPDGSVVGNTSNGSYTRYPNGDVYMQHTLPSPLIQAPLWNYPIALKEYYVDAQYSFSSYGGIYFSGNSYWYTDANRYTQGAVTCDSLPPVGVAIGISIRGRWK
jgi:hypothetical protein